MKKLLLMRHAKSSWSHPNLSDHERPLNNRGHKAAKLMGKLLNEKDIIPDTILCSTAKRAKSTAKRLVKQIPFDNEIQYIDSLYHSDFDQIFSLLKQLPDTIQTAMVIGHNPDMECFLEICCGANERIPTAAIAEITFALSSWHDLSQEEDGKLENLWLPREH